LKLEAYVSTETVYRNIYKYTWPAFQAYNIAHTAVGTTRNSEISSNPLLTFVSFR